MSVNPIAKKKQASTSSIEDQLRWCFGFQQSCVCVVFCCIWCVLCVFCVVFVVVWVCACMHLCVCVCTARWQASLLDSITGPSVMLPGQTVIVKNFDMVVSFTKLFFSSLLTVLLLPPPTPLSSLTSLLPWPSCVWLQVLELTLFIFIFVCFRSKCRRKKDYLFLNMLTCCI